MKMEEWRYIPFGTFTAVENMAIDEMLLDEVIAGTSTNTLRFYKWNPSAVSIGAHQSLAAEVDRDAAHSNHIDVVRRISGGGAVFHDFTGEITYAVVCHLDQLPKIDNPRRLYDSSIPPRYYAILEALAVGLESAGIPIDVGKIHCPALLMGGMKISGNAQILRNNVLLQHGTILLHVQPELMYKVLKAPEGVSYTKMIHSVRSKVKGIWDDEHQLEKSEANVIDALRNGFRTIFHTTFQTQPFSEAESKKIQKLIESRYANPKWLEKYH